MVLPQPDAHPLLPSPQPQAVLIRMAFAFPSPGLPSHSPGLKSPLQDPPFFSSHLELRVFKLEGTSEGLCVARQSTDPSGTCLQGVSLPCLDSP